MMIKKYQAPRKSNGEIYKELQLMHKDMAAFNDQMNKRYIENEELKIKIEKENLDNARSLTQETLKIQESISKIADGFKILEHTIFGNKDDPNNPGILLRCKQHADELASVKTFITNHEIGTAIKVGEKQGKVWFWDKLKNWQKTAIPVIGIALTLTGQFAIFKACTPTMTPSPIISTQHP